MIHWFHYGNKHILALKYIWDSKYKMNTKQEQSILEMYAL